MADPTGIFQGTLETSPVVPIYTTDPATLEPFTDAQLAAPYRVYEVRSRTVYDSGNLVLAPAADGTGLEQEQTVVQIATPTAYRVVTFEMERFGCECIPPDPTPQENEILLRATVEEDAPNPSSDANSATFRMRGVYIFVPAVPGLDALASELSTATLTTAPAYIP